MSVAAGVAAVAACKGFDVALDNCCSKCRILVCIKSMLRAETWVVSAEGEAGSAVTLADDSTQVGVADTGSPAGAFPFGIWTDCAGVWRWSGWIERGRDRAGCGSSS